MNDPTAPLLPTTRQLAAIEEHSAGLAAVARDNLGREVEHCPGWSVADLVRHVTEVHWFWGTIAERRLSAPPEEGQRPARPPKDRLVDEFEAGARRLVDVLRAADGEQPVWTWAPGQQDVAFITRHQVQEAAVHHWDAAHATGAGISIATDVAVDSVEEFLTFSLSTEADPAEPARPPLAGAFGLRAVDAGTGWNLTDGATPGTVRVAPATSEDVPVVRASAVDLLLWLYQRVELDTSPVPAELVARFRALCFTD